MTHEEIAVKLEDHEHEIGSLKHRMKAAEEANRALNRLATAVEVLAARQSSMSNSMERLAGKVEALESKPAHRWDAFVEKILFALAGALAAGLIGTAA